MKKIFIKKADVDIFLNKNIFDIYITDKHNENLLEKLSLPHESLFLVSSADLTTADKIILNVGKGRNIVGIGSGKVLDIAKYVASKTKAHLSLIPTVFSTNCFATNKSTLFTKTGKLTLHSIAPEVIILDFKRISKAPTMNIFGIMELLSSYTALNDWLIADRGHFEKIDEVIYRKARRLVQKTITISGEKKNRNFLNKIFALLMESGLLTRMYGNGRPVSGSEHIFSAKIENYYRCPHGLAHRGQIHPQLRYESFQWVPL